MTTFKKGDRFIPHKPKENKKNLKWTPRMDEYNNKILTVEHISPYTGVIHTDDCPFVFHPDWCEKVGNSEIPNNQEKPKQFIETREDYREAINGMINFRANEYVLNEVKEATYTETTIANAFKAGVNFVRVSNWENNPDTILSTSASIINGLTFVPQEFPPKQTIGYSTTLEQALKAQEIPNNHIHEVGKTIDWEQRRYELAKSALQGILSNPVYHHAITVASDERRVNQLRGLVDISLQTAESMIGLLKETEKQLKGE